MMKKATVIAVMVLTVLIWGASSGLAFNGNGAGDGSGPIHDIFSGNPFVYTGIITDCVPGEGAIIAVDDVGEVIVYGIGPTSYWEELGVARPAVGDTITVEGYTVVYDSVVLNIATSILVGDDTLDLRDGEGLPLWR